MSTPLAVTARLCQRDVSGDARTAPKCHRLTLADLSDGTTMRVLGVCDDSNPEIARRLFDLGFMAGVEVTRLRSTLFGDPIIVRVADYEVALRRSQAGCIVVAPQGISDGGPVQLGLPRVGRSGRGRGRRGKRGKHDGRGRVAPGCCEVCGV